MREAERQQTQGRARKTGEADHARAEAMCDNCPFAPSGPGADLRRSLRPGRFEGIAQAVWLGVPFYCHKTTDDDRLDEDGDEYRATGKERHCGGALAFVRRAQENRERSSRRGTRRARASAEPCEDAPA